MGITVSQKELDYFKEFIKWPSIGTTATIPATWFKENCKGRWGSILYYYHFENIEDLILFKLTWGNM